MRLRVRMMRLRVLIMRLRVLIMRLRVRIPRLREEVPVEHVDNAQVERDRFRHEPAAPVTPGPGADVGGASAVPAQMWAGLSPVLVQMWQA